MTDDLELDYTERQGFMVGKTAALADWKFRKDEKAFNRLIATVRATNWNRAHSVRRKVIALSYWHRNKERLNAAKRVKARKAPRTRKCDMCPVVYELPYPHPRGRVRRVCSPECRRLKENQKAREYQTKAARAKGRKVRSCTECNELGHNRRTCPRLVAKTTTEAA
jgi:hypothetical protein